MSTILIWLAFYLSNLIMPRYFVITIIFSVACSSGGNKIQNEIFTVPTEIASKSGLNYNLKIIDTLFIPVDSTTRAVNHVNFHYSSDKDELLFDYNPANHSIQAYNLHSKTKEYHVYLQKTGPEKLEEVIGMYVHSPDSIFLITESPKRRIVLIDKQGTIFKDWLVKDALANNEDYDLYFSDNFVPTYNSKINSLVIGIAPYIEPWKPAYYEQPFLVEYDFSKERVVQQYGYFPYPGEIYFFQEELGRFKYDNKEVVHFYGSDMYFIHDYQTKKLEKIVKVPSKYIKGRIPAIGKQILKDEDMTAQSKYFLETGSYMATRYDPYSKMMYRLVKKPMDYLNLDGIRKSYNEIEYSLMLLNNNFEIIDEIDLEAGHFNTKMIFLNEKGLWISANNPLNSSIDEDILTLICFKPIITQPLAL